MNRFYFLIFLGVLLGNAYSQEDVILPLAVGNYWLFEDSTRVSVMGSTKITYEQSELEVFFWKWDQVDFIWLMRNQSDGLWVYGTITDNDTMINPELLLKYPTEVGDTWQCNWSSGGDTVIAETSVKDTMITTPAGSFNSIEYLQTAKNPETNTTQQLSDKIFYGPLLSSKVNKLQKRDGMHVLFAPGIGYVKRYSVEGGEIVGANSIIAFNVVTSIREKSSVGRHFVLQQNYPNPFNPNTIIKFQLAEAEYVSLDVFNALGQKVENLFRAKISAGSHQVVFNAGNFPSGVYFYKLTAGNNTEIKKMLLIR